MSETFNQPDPNSCGFWSTVRWPRRQAGIITAAFFSFFFGGGYWYAGLSYAVDVGVFGTAGMLLVWVLCRIAVAYLEWPAQNPLIRGAKKALLWLLFEDERGLVE